MFAFLCREDKDRSQGFCVVCYFSVTDVPEDKSIGTPLLGAPEGKERGSFIYSYSHL